jgi:hypothetical protein
MLLALDFEVASDILKAVLLPTEIDLTQYFAVVVGIKITLR